ncbi:hypothetical protein ACP70R_045260 [Stipagrostis hirtigluma subsp. patula]
MEKVHNLVSGGFSVAQAVEWILSAGSSSLEAAHLSNDLELLKKSLPKARILINHGEWGMFKDKNLAELVSHLKETTNDAEDLLRQFEDQMLRQKIEGAGRSRAGRILSSSLSLARIFIYGSKKRVKEIQDKLDKVVADVESVLDHVGISIEPGQLMPETSSNITASEVFGRDSERDAVIKMLGVTIGREDACDQVMQQLGVIATKGSAFARSKGKKAATKNGGASTSRPAKRLRGNSSRATLSWTNCTGDNVSVVPIFGIGGVGKTTLAQVIYNDSRVKRHFVVRIWVCVSDFFDKKKITKEIVESISGEEFSGPCTLNALREELREQLKCHKFLLVLDDIWPNANHQWEEFYAPLRQGIEGSMIIVTTRYPMVADLVVTKNCHPVQLGGLPDDIFWKFFTKCAFGTKDPESYPDLQVIGKSICSRLCGSPLAAKTLGRLLNMCLTKEHWMTVKNSELWQLPYQENEILPALRLTYLYLPQELKRCFAFCSMFEKDYSFVRQEIVDIWVAVGFVAPVGSMRLEDVGMRYLDDLRSRFLFQSDPKFPNQSRYVMHDLIHDMAQSMSMDECFLMQDFSHQKQRTMPHTVRHMSIGVGVDGESLSRLRDIQHLNKLHSLRFGNLFDVEITWFNQLSNILFLSLKGCKLEKLPESICELNSLRYLDISHSSVRELPDKLWCLYSLQILDASRSSLKTIHQDVTKLINLRHLALPWKASVALSRVTRLGNLSCLRNLVGFTVARKNGRGIDELKSMNHLSGTLSIRSLHNVQSAEEAAEARLFDKQYLKELRLYWEESCMAMRPRPHQNEAVEGLRPHSNIERLNFNDFSGDSFAPSWFRPEYLRPLKALVLRGCRYLKSLSVPYLASLELLELRVVGIECLTVLSDGIQAGLTGDDRTQHASSSSSRSNGIAFCAFTRLTALRISCCSKLTNLDQFLSPENLPFVKSIVLRHCGNLVSIPVHSFVGFACLQDLKIQWCDKLVCPREMRLPPSLRRLQFDGSAELHRSIPACLENLTSLVLLKLVSCKHVFLPLTLIAGTNMLKCLVLDSCWELSSIGGSHCLSTIQHVEISSCPKLTEVEQPFVKKELRTKEGKELLKFLSWLY